MIETRTCIITLLEKDMLRLEYKPDCFVEAGDFEENLEAYKKVMTTERVYLLVVVGNGAEPSPEVRQIYSSKERSSFKHAEAFVINSLAQKIIANFVTRVQPPFHPMKFFSREKDALSWLYRQKELNESRQELKRA